MDLREVKPAYFALNEAGGQRFYSNLLWVLILKQEFRGGNFFENANGILKDMLNHVQLTLTGYSSHTPEMRREQEKMET